MTSLARPSLSPSPPTGEASLRLLQIGAEWQTEVMGGANRYTYDLAGAFGGLGIEQQWAVVGHRPDSPADRCRVEAVAPPESRLPVRLRAMRHAVQAGLGGHDVVTSHFALYGSAALTRRRDIPHVVHFHGPWADESAAEGAGPMSVRAKRWLERRVYRSGTRCITLSSAFASYLMRCYGVVEERVRVVPGGVRASDWEPGCSRQDARERLDWPMDRPVLLCVRRLARRMGIDRLLDAVVELRLSHPDLLVMVAGKGPQQEALRRQVSELGLEENCRFLGFVPDDNLPLAYRAADLSLVPSHSLEGFGLTVLESLAAGTPVLVTPVGGLPEVVNELNPGLVLPDTSASSMAEAVDQVLLGKFVLPTADECQAYVRSRFDWSVIAPCVLGVYREAIDDHG